MAMKQWLRLTKEATYGTFDASASAGNILWIRITGDNSFSMNPEPMTYLVRSADARNRKVLEVSSRVQVHGTLNTLLYAEQADNLLGWGTTLTSDDLPSYTADYFDSVRVRRTLGVKVKQLQVSGASETNEGALSAQFQLWGQKPASDPTLAEPALSVFPTAIYKFIESKGGLVLATSGSTARTKYKSFSLTINNMLQDGWDEDQYITDLTYNGRDVDWSFALRFLSKTDRDNYESRATYSGSIVFTKPSPAHTLTLTFNAANRIGSLAKDLPLGANAYETVSLSTFLDVAVPGDFSYVAT